CEELASRAFGVPVPRRLARLWLWAPSSSGARFRAHLGALRVWVGLRERFDADWYRNPRAAEALRAAAEPGGRASVEGWADELGAGTDEALARAAELLRF
ncbi:MAG: hypothetical protein KF901_07800, partial [Myxococcales bacterium]|nr:hypothetical protein [Myxococcales bacterium]